MEGKEKDLAAWRRNLVDLMRGDEAGTLETAPEEGGAGEAASDRREFLAFVLGGETFGVDIRCVSEILMPRPVTRLPRAPGFILGIVGLRGAILPVADTAVRLGLRREPSDAYARIVVLKDGDEAMGFVVDAVAGVIRFAPEEVTTTQYATSVDPLFLTGIGYDARQRLIILLSPERLCGFSLEDG